VATAQAQAQVYPAIAGLDAVFAHVFAGMGEFYLVKMCALRCHAASCLTLPVSTAVASKNHTPFWTFLELFDAAGPDLDSPRCVMERQLSSATKKPKQIA
jgi:hypothetical protein